MNESKTKRIFHARGGGETQCKRIYIHIYMKDIREKVKYRVISMKFAMFAWNLISFPNRWIEIICHSAHITHTHTHAHSPHSTIPFDDLEGFIQICCYCFEIQNKSFGLKRNARIFGEYFFFRFQVNLNNDFHWQKLARIVSTPHTQHGTIEIPDQVNNWNKKKKLLRKESKKWNEMKQLSFTWKSFVLQPFSFQVH